MIRAAEARVPHVFVAPLRERAARRLAWGGLTGLTLYCLILFDFSPVRLWNGLSGFGLIAGLMVPPRTNCFFLEFAYAILETLSMAIIGTLIASAIRSAESRVAQESGSTLRYRWWPGRLQKKTPKK